MVVFFIRGKKQNSVVRGNFIFLFSLVKCKSSLVRSLAQAYRQVPSPSSVTNFMDGPLSLPTYCITDQRGDVRGYVLGEARGKVSGWKVSVGNVRIPFRKSELQFLKFSMQDSRLQVRRTFPFDITYMSGELGAGVGVEMSRVIVLDLISVSNFVCLFYLI